LGRGQAGDPGAACMGQDMNQAILSPATKPPGLPRVAVVLCSHNGSRFIGRQLDSIASQHLPVDEIHVFDWNSSDDTVKIVRERASAGMPIRLTCRSEAPGAARSFLDALGQVARESSADLILLADQDDEWLPEKTQVLVNEFAGSRFDLGFSDVCIIDSDGRPLTRSFYESGSPYVRPSSRTDDAMLLTNPAIGMTMCISRDWLVRVSPALRHNWIMHDWALCILCHLTGADLRYIDRPLVLYRQHGANQMGAAQARSHLSRLVRLRQHVGRIRRQFRSVERSAEDLHVEDRGRTLLAAVSGRLRQARLSWSPLLRPGYRIALAGAMLIL
jgi:glycosyltransferase involved in cell wall biosynthesis